MVPVRVLGVAGEEAPDQLSHLLIGQDIPEPISCHDNHIIILQLQLVHMQHDDLQIKPRPFSACPSINLFTFWADGSWVGYCPFTCGTDSRNGLSRMLVSRTLS